MRKHAKELGALAVSRLNKLGFFSVGGVAGLGLHLTAPKGELIPTSRSWILRIRIHGRRRDMGLGSYPSVTLSDARERARELRLLVDVGIDPIEERRTKRADRAAALAKQTTFAQCVDAYLDAHGDSWKSAKHRMQWANTLSTYANPIIGKLNVAAIDTGLVLQVLEPIWKTKTETANRVRGRIENILSWATTRGYRQGENPARWQGHLDQLLAAPSKIAKPVHHPALPYSQIGAFMAELAKMDGLGARALEFTVLCASRSGEVRKMVWGEVDLKAGVWTVPGDRMKMGREHRVPLSDKALEIIKGLPQTTDLVFPGMKGQALSDMSLSAVLRRMGRGDLTVHGFRSSFRDWVSEQTAYPAEVAEMALAHAIKSDVEAAYRRGDLFEKRRRLMADWATYAYTPAAAGATVTPIRGGV